MMEGKFVVIGAQRSGTTVLCDMLASHPAIKFRATSVCPGHPEYEAFQPNELMLQHESVYFKSLFVPGCVSGFKMLYSHLAHRTNLLVENPDVKLIFVRRRNKLRQYVSKLRADYTGWWSDRSTGQPKDSFRCFITPDTFRSYMDGLEVERAPLWALPGYKISVEYDDIARQNLGAVCAFLGLPTWKIKTVLRKQESSSLEVRIVNYDEIAKLFPQFIGPDAGA